MNSDLMIDYETAATGNQPAILTMGAVKFDPLGSESTMTSFYCRVDLDSCIAHGLEVHESTIEWWGKQSAEAQEEALGDGTPDNPRLSLPDAFAALRRFALGSKRVWSNGATADIIWSESAFRKVGIAIPWQFWQVRDVRTIFDIGFNPKMPTITAHNALEDAYHQAVGVQTVFQQLVRSSNAEPFTNWKR